MNPRRYLPVLFLACIALACKLFAAGGGAAPTPSPVHSPAPPTSSEVPSLASPSPSLASPPPAPALQISGTPAPELCTSFPASYQALDGEQVQRLADDLAALTAGLEIPRHLTQENAARQGDEWDVNQYFTVLTHLSLPSGSALDYVYDYAGIGGMPVLYTRPSGQSPYATLAELGKAHPEPIPPGTRLPYVAGVRIEETLQGFLEYALLAAHGGQFYLFWHANYFDDVTLAAPAALETVLAGHTGGDHGAPMTPEIQQAARRLLLTPAVEMGAEQVRVRLVSFSKWGGLSVQIYTLPRFFPFAPVQVDVFNCVPYEVGIQF